MPTDQIDYSHADTGTKPSAPQDAQSGEAADPELYDWFVNTFVTKINSLASDVSDILDGTLTVGEADAVDGWDKADIKGWVNQSADVPNADKADDATTVKGNDLDSDGDGRVDAADHATTADKIKGNDVDSDGDGRVDAADTATLVDGTDIFANAGFPSETGEVDASFASNFYMTELADEETLRVDQMTFATANGAPLPTGCDLVIATLGGGGSSAREQIVFSGDGSTAYIDETGEPIAQHTNTTGGTQIVALMADNGQFNSGTGDLVKDVRVDGIVRIE